MKVFKFGGASLKSAAAIRNMAAIVAAHLNGPLIVVVSAMGKTTNTLERILEISRKGNDAQHEMQSVQEYHLKLIEDLFPDPEPVINLVNVEFYKLKENLQLADDYDKVYDQVVSLGEIISSIIVEKFLEASGVPTAWVDARKYIITDTCFREGKVMWDNTAHKMLSLKPVADKSIIVTQGFIGGTENELITTLGREGSDYSAAIFASCLQAESVTIWKDVPGIMSSDPKRLPSAVVFDELPYKEAAEMTYYGASVIHPKTIKPLALKQIPLSVKSFDDPSLPGTIIHDCHVDNLPSLIVFKDNQCLISCQVTDYTFVNERQLGSIFQALSALDIKINVMQNSAISFSFCIDFRENKVVALIEKLQHHFEVYYNTGLTLITVKNYTEETFNTYRKIPGILLEQSSRSTLQVLVKELRTH
jgi:aspartate kinase